MFLLNMKMEMWISIQKNKKIPVSRKTLKLNWDFSSNKNNKKESATFQSLQNCVFDHLQNWNKNGEFKR